MKKGILKISDDAFRIILIIIGSIISTLVLLFSILATIKVTEGDLVGASSFLFTIFIILGLSRLVTLVRERTKIALIRFVVLFVFNIILGILVFLGNYNQYFYSLVGGLFCLSIIVSRVFKIIQNHTIRSIILNSIIILFAALLSIGLFMPLDEGLATLPIIIVCVIVTATAIIEVLSNAFSQLKFKTLFKIIFRTFALEVLLGLLTMIVASALIFSTFEESIPSFGDGLWYAFAVVTTIGFGDYAATTVLGRVVTVLLGIYGLIVVAVITSIIVNFYNETAGKRDSQELKEINKENKKQK